MGRKKIKRKKWMRKRVKAQQTLDRRQRFNKGWRQLFVDAGVLEKRS